MDIRKIAALLTVVAVTSLVSALTIEKGVTYKTNGDVCDKVTWTDKAGAPRTIWLTQATGENTCACAGGGATQRIEYNTGSATRICDWNGGGLGGFGFTINHGAWNTRAWLNSREETYDIASGFVFAGDHHALWKFRGKMGIYGNDAPPYYWVTVAYLIKDGEDQFQWMVTFDASPIPKPDTALGLATADSRSPYGSINWWGSTNYQNINTGYRYGTSHTMILNLVTGTDGKPSMDLSTFNGTQPYNLCPYNMAWDEPVDAEMGYIQTRLQTAHHAGIGYGVSNGTTGTLASFGHDFQFSEFQGWYGGRMTWDTRGPGGYGQIGVSQYTENYSLTIMFDKYTNGGVLRMVDEANAIMNAATRLAATVGIVDTAGREALDLPYLRAWDKAGFDQVYRNWVVAANNNSATATLTLQTGTTLANPTLVLSGYTARTKPATVSKGGASLVEGSGYYCSIDTAAQECWITFLSSFSNATTVSVTGPTDATGLTVGALAVSPAIVNSVTGTTLTFSISSTGAASATLDLTGLGGGSSVAMTAGGAGFTLQHAAPAGIKPANILVTATVRSASGFKTSRCSVPVKIDDMIMYTDAVNRVAPSWQPCGASSEVTDATNAYEGSKALKWTIGTSTQCLCAYNFDQWLANVRTFGFFNIAYKGPAMKLTLHCKGNFDTPSASLPASTSQYSYVSIPVGTFGAGSVDSVDGFRVFTTGTGIAYFDNISFTSIPPSTFIPLETAPLKMTAASLASRIEFRGRMVSTNLQKGMSVQIVDLIGRTLTHSKKEGGFVWRASKPGTYLVLVKQAGRTIISKMVSR